MELSPKLIEDYYKNRSVEQICKEAGISRTTFQRLKTKYKLPNRRSFLSKIDTGDKNLDQTMKTKYLSIVNRCNGMSTDKYGHYKGLDYMTLQEWVELCNLNKNILLKLWGEYIRLDKRLKHAVSIDRTDTAKGYTADNIRFVPHGYNSWLRNLFPVKIVHSGETRYFMSSAEASRHYGLNEQRIGEVLKNVKYHVSGYEAVPSTVYDVLCFAKTSLREYYEKYISESD